MSADFDRLREIFHAAVERHTPDQWDAYLDQTCAGDDDLRRQVAVLLQAHADDGPSLDWAAPAGDGTGIYHPTTERPGMVIGPYKLLEPIGEGGFGAVFM